MGSSFLNTDFKGLIDTSQVKIPSSALDRIIGQSEAVRLAKVSAKQGRHLLLVGPPGVGKSMIAQAMSFYIPRPTEEIRAVHNPLRPERPFVEIKTSSEISEEMQEDSKTEEQLVDPKDAPAFVSERLGYRCSRCGFISSYTETVCPNCNSPKVQAGTTGPFGDVFNVLGINQLFLSL